MPSKKEEALKYLKEFRLKHLFTQVLGWDDFRYTDTLDFAGIKFKITGVANKRGVQVYMCSPDVHGNIPDSTLRQKIERQVSKIAYEHLLIFSDSEQSEQLWVYPRREKGKPARLISYRFDKKQRNEPLLQKLESIAFAIDEEEELTLFEVQKRLRETLDRDKLTKKFYTEFASKRSAFQKFLKGIPDKDMEQWYVAVLINRLMFIYFIQSKGFLDNGSRRYLQDRLDMFDGNYYRDFLRPLFFEGFALPEDIRPAKLRALLGSVPYLNGGIFQEHEIEKKYGDDIQIENEAFAQLYRFFDKYKWHLDERPLKNDNEINPDVLGYIFEKYINQKQMGAYYTKEDITEYITKNTVIPYLFEAAKPKCRIAFDNPDGPTIWDLLCENPDKYIYPAMKHGVTWAYDAEHPEQGVERNEPIPYPEHIAIGLDTEQPDLLERRKRWNTPAPPDAGLPTEIWRETVARRQRYEEVKAKLASGAVRDINDLITLNLDIRQFAEDVIAYAEGPELLRAMWKAIEKISVLDPTCGSGAFLFAALNILESLYLACLTRMEMFIEDLENSGSSHSPEKYSDFRKVLAKVATHPNKEYFVYKSIILNNLYGVDIMEEAVEICKLRLFLKLAAQVEPDTNRPNMGIEPLPDIDFNIRAGNTLVGYATYGDVEKAVTGKLDFENSMDRIRLKAEDLQQYFDAFRKKQTEGDGSVPADDKLLINARLHELENELNKYLAGEYLGEKYSDKKYSEWLKSHQPFHWFIEFYGIMNSGGFDVIVGNPPYVEISTISNEYKMKGLTLIETGNLFSVCTERFTDILLERGKLGVIFPISSLSTPRMLPLMRYLICNMEILNVSNYAVRPGKLFVGVDMNLTIILGCKGKNAQTCLLNTTQYQRWFVSERDTLFSRLQFEISELSESKKAIAKCGTSLDYKLINKTKVYPLLSMLRSKASTADTVFYHSGGRYFRKCLRRKLSNEYKELKLAKGAGNVVLCLLSSSFFYWYWLVFSDTYHVTSIDVNEAPIPKAQFDEKIFNSFADELDRDLWKNAEHRLRNRADGTQDNEVNFKVSKSKPIIDKIDNALAPYYNFTELELDYIINYDIKYRMGLGNLAVEEEE